MLKERAEYYYTRDNCNCAESVLLAANDTYHLCLPTGAEKLVGGFGRGMGCGNTCGALCGAISALGAIRMGRRAHETEGFGADCAALVEKFEVLMQATDCGTIRPREALPEKRCLKVVWAACDALESQLAEKTR